MKRTGIHVKVFWVTPSRQNLAPPSPLPPRLYSLILDVVSMATSEMRTARAEKRIAGAPAQFPLDPSPKADPPPDLEVQVQVKVTWSWLPELEAV